MPLITVGIPCYNEEEYIGRAITSVLNQSFPDIELVISDNCSTDKTDEIIKEYASQDKRISYYRQSINVGATENFKFVFDKCDSKYFTWLAADDFFDTHWLEVAVCFLEQNSETILVYPKTHYLNTSILSNSDAEQYIDTTGINAKTAIIETFLKRKCCSFGIYGVYRTSVLRSIVHPNIWCSDQIMMSHTYSLGSVKLIDHVYIIRTFRDGSHEQATQKEKRLGIVLFKAMDALLFDITKKLYEIRFVVFHSKLTFGDKLELVGQLISNLYEIRQNKAMSYLYQKHPFIYKIARYFEGIPIRLQRQWKKIANSN